MKTLNDIWGELGELPEDEHIHVLTKLFSVYENRLRKNDADPEARDFFKNLENVIEQTAGCNLNRR